MFPAGGRCSRKGERRLRGPFMGRETPPCVRPFGLGSRPSIPLSLGEASPGLALLQCPFRPAGAWGGSRGVGKDPRAKKCVLGSSLPRLGLDHFRPSAGARPFHRLPLVSPLLLEGLFSPIAL